MGSVAPVRRRDNTVDTNSTGFQDIEAGEVGSNTYSDAYVGTDASRRKTVPQSGISCPLLHGCLSPGQGAMPLALGPPALPALPAQGPARSIKSGGSHLGKNSSAHHFIVG